MSTNRNFIDRAGQPQWRVEVAFVQEGDGDDFFYDTVNADYDSAKYSSGELDVTWIDITARFLSATITRGRDSIDTRFPPGSATVNLVDDDGIFNPDAQGVSGVESGLRVGSFVRLSARASISHAWIFQWTGTIDTITESFAPGGASIVTRLNCSDLASTISRMFNPSGSPVGAGELTSQRVERVIDEAFFYEAARVLDVGVNHVQATTLTRSFLEECQIAADAEGGAFYCNGAGAFVFRNAAWLDDETPVLNVGQSGQPVQIIDAPALRWNSGTVRNDVQFSRVGGTVQRVQGPESIARYGRRASRKLDLENVDDGEVFTLASTFLDRNQWDVARFTSIELHAEDADSVAALLSLEIADVLNLEVRTLRGWSVNLHAWVQRISHTVNADDWTFRLVVENVDRDRPGTGGPFDSAFDPAEFDVDETP